MIQGPFGIGWLFQILIDQKMIKRYKYENKCYFVEGDINLVS